MQTSHSKRRYRKVGWPRELIINTLYGFGMKGKRISESKKKQLLRREKEEMKKDIPIKKMKMGGKVEEYGAGGNVKGGKMSCRGMGAAVKGGGYTIS